MVQVEGKGGDVVVLHRAMQHCSALCNAQQVGHSQDWDPSKHGACVYQAV